MRQNDHVPNRTLDKRSRAGTGFAGVFLAASLVPLIGLGASGCNKSDTSPPGQEKGSPPPDLPEPAPQDPAAVQTPPPSDPAHAGQPPAGDPAAPGDEAPGSADGEAVTDAELESFVATQVELASLQQEIAQKAPESPSQTDLEKLQGEFQQRAMQIVQQSSLGVQRYEEIAGIVQRKPELQQRVQALVLEKTGG